MSTNPTPSILFNSCNKLMSAKLNINCSSAVVSLLVIFKYSNILFTSFSVVTPALITSSGNSSKTVVTLFCTLTAAKSGSVPTLKATVISVKPLLLDTEDI